LLFEIDPADYQTALASAKASVANLEAILLQKQQDLTLIPWGAKMAHGMLK
jgi:multidrug resistance efflux pump